ncbi:LLM class flavin-dependent oxidoreductase [Nesterenkonia sp. MY13]|uniref:LLM class flavin-dependent oxidoreductase n=1 Tax=Nesterenkonia sedimenti TaxID=1463632 RepID=A0A7X8YEF2_9MICC|nr:LLM class flavin-dependent oxidoreductase [Nesterenkonia sedimenti]NLS10763.1 LLM class flavin-dependent oxidoreductase [Nesterenkonia sedimenti]
MADTAHPQPWGIAPSDALITQLLTTPGSAAYAQLRDVIDLTSGVIYLGAQRFHPARAAAEQSQTGYLDPLVAAQALLSRLPQATALVSTSPDVEHPYNYARRTASLDHFTQGRIGVVLGSRDHRIDHLGTPGTAWTTQPTGAELTEEFGTVLRKLWNSWPRESILADKDQGRYADSSLIKEIAHSGHYRVAGPLSSFSSVQGEPPLGWHLSLGDSELPHTQQAELLITHGQDVAEPPGQTAEREDLLLAELVDPQQLTTAQSTWSSNTDGFLVAVEDLEQLPAVIAALSGMAEIGEYHQPAACGTLRQRLGLVPRRYDLTEMPRAFASTAQVAGF